MRILLVTMRFDFVFTKETHLYVPFNQIIDKTFFFFFCQPKCKKKKTLSFMIYHNCLYNNINTYFGRYESWERLLGTQITTQISVVALNLIKIIIMLETIYLLPFAKFAYYKYTQKRQNYFRSNFRSIIRI